MRHSKQFKKIFTILFLTAVMILFSKNLSVLHFDHPESNFVEVVNNSSRLEHAKELLGKEFQDSHAQIVSSDELNRQILEQVRTSLPPKFKKQARKVARTIIQESSKHQIDPFFIMAIIKTESSFNPLAKGGVGEIGLMQIKPDTAEWMAGLISHPWKGAKTLEDPSENIILGTAYISLLRDDFKQKPVRYVGAYNMGPGNMRKMIKKNRQPSEYRSRVMNHYSKMYSKIYKNSPVSTWQGVIASNL